MAHRDVTATVKVESKKIRRGNDKAAIREGLA